MTDTTEPRETREKTRFEPGESAAGKPFWEASRDRRLELPWCIDCARPHWFPREVCPFCLGSGIEWRDASGRGVVHALSVQHRAPWPALGDRVPYAVALIDLDEGVRMMSNVVGASVDEVEIGAPVRLRWEALSDGRNLPQFEPT